MAIDFPNSPSTNDTYTVNGRTYTWNGQKWKRTKPSLTTVVPTLTTSSDFTVGGSTTVGGNIVPDTDVTYDLGSSTYRFRDLYLSGNSIDLGGMVISYDGSSVSMAPSGGSSQVFATEGYVDTAVANLINSAPDALNTLDELAAALGDDANYATTITNALAGKSDTGHTHSYAATSHTHSYAATSHTHSYASTSHTHSYLSTSGGTLSGSLTATNFQMANHTISNPNIYYAAVTPKNYPSYGITLGEYYSRPTVASETRTQPLYLVGGGSVQIGVHDNNRIGYFNTAGIYLEQGWYRTYNQTGWYNETYNGGTYMTDSNYVRIYNSKGLQSNKYGSSNYDTASIYINAANSSTLSFHPGGQAPQIRVGYNNNTFYFRNWPDTGWAVCELVLINHSSRVDKQDITDFANRPSSLSSDGNSEYARSGTDIVRKLRPRHYRWDWDKNMRQLPLSQRRTEALSRLNAYREKQGLGEFLSDESWHVCGRDCDGTETDPCWWVKDWQNGYFGFVAEEVGEVAPEAGRLSPETGELSGLDPMAMSAIIVASLQEVLDRLDALEAK